MAYPYNLDFLSKNDLKFELKMRGIPVDENWKVAQLRKVLRRVFRSVDKDISKYPDYDLNSEIEYVNKEIHEVVKKREELESKGYTSGLLSCKHKCGALLARLETVTTLALSETVLTKVKKNCEIIKQAYEYFNQALKQAPQERILRLESKLQEKHAGDESNYEFDEGNFSFKEGDVEIEIPERGVEFGEICQEAEEIWERECKTEVKQGGTDIEVQVQEWDPEVFNFGTRVQISDRENCGETDKHKEEYKREFNVNRDYTSTPVINRPAISHRAEFYDSKLFNKLSNPLEHLVKDFEVTDGLDQTKLRKFLGNVIKIKKNSDLSTKQLLQIASSYTKGPLRERVEDSIFRNHNWEQVHESLLQYFIPRAQRDRLVRELVCRPQSRGEDISIYLSSLTEHSEVLNTQYTPRELIDIFMTGLNPDERSRLVMSSYPRDLRDLEQICITSNNVRYSDLERQRREQENQRGNETRGFFRGNTGNRNSREIRCYVCSKIGHLARECRSNRNSGEFVPRGNYYQNRGNNNSRGSYRGNNYRGNQRNAAQNPKN